jgi:hypothetical protein
MTLPTRRLVPPARANANTAGLAVNGSVDTAGPLTSCSHELSWGTLRQIHFKSQATDMVEYGLHQHESLLASILRVCKPLIGPRFHEGEDFPVCLDPPEFLKNHAVLLGDDAEAEQQDCKHGEAHKAQNGVRIRPIR